MQAAEHLAANGALLQHGAIALETLLSSVRAAKPPRAVDLGSFYWCVSRLGCVGGKLPISRDCASRKGSYWNSKQLPPL